MNKVIAVILLSVGIFLLVEGINLTNETERRNDNLIEKFRDNVDNTYHEQNVQQKAIGIAMIVAGSLFIIFGLKGILKSDSQNDSKTLLSKNNLADQTSIDFLSLKLSSLLKQKDYTTGIAIIKKIIAIDPTSKEAYFNLACLYSLTENNECFNAISKSVENGYTNFEKIRTYPDLNWVRRQPNFQAFANAGYKLSQIDSKNNSAFISEELVSQIERLGKLKDQGLITEDEFLEQKRKILDRN